MNAVLAAPPVSVDVLGPVCARMGDRAVPLGGPKDRGVLAQLALAEGHMVSEARLIDGTWGEAQPVRAGKAVQNQILRLRRCLRAVTDSPVIVTEAGGYRLAPEACSTDLAHAEELIAQARSCAAIRHHEAASSWYAEALGHWRGAPLTDVATLPFASAASTRLDELRWTAFEERVEADLACGRHQRLVAELYQAVHDAPLRECLWGQLMISLYRSGRQAEALRVFQQLRYQLDCELGLAPGDELVAIERAIATGTLPTKPAAPPRTPGGDRFVDAIVDRPRAQGLDRLELAAGDVVTREGDPGDRAFIIVSGEAAVSIGGRVVAQLGPGEIVGEMALLDGSPRVATVTALGSLHLLAVPREVFGGLLEDRSVAARLLGTIVRRLRDVDQGMARSNPA